MQTQEEHPFSSLLRLEKQCEPKIGTSQSMAHRKSRISRRNNEKILSIRRPKTLFLMNWILMGIALSSLLIRSADAIGKPIVQKCATCRFLVKTFKKGMKETTRGKFDGGDAAWESAKLGKYARSETRLVEIMEHLCKKDDETKLEGLDAIAVSEKELEYKCHTMAEDIEEHVENWYFHKQQNFPNMEAWLCTDTIKYCCPWGLYGEKCEPCPGSIERPCFGNGNCDGSGTRTGTGKCNCFKGYQGNLCRHCTGGHFLSQQNDTHVTCTECDESCKGCTGEGPENCKACKSGWRAGETGCEDIDECLEFPCKAEHEECENKPGTYECNCMEGYKKEADKCVLDIAALSNQGKHFLGGLLSAEQVLRYTAVFGLVLALILIIMRRSLGLAVFFGLTLVVILAIEYGPLGDMLRSTSAPLTQEEAAKFIPKMPKREL